MLKKVKKQNREGLTEIHGASSFWLKSDKIELYVTEEGGHLAPVKFKLKHRWVSPYSLAPWEPSEIDESNPALLKNLRGDFFCFPFGESRAVSLPHGESANCRWELEERTVLNLGLKLKLTQPDGEMAKHISLLPDQRAIYQEHVVSGVQGRFNYGTHAILQFAPNEKGYINTSPFHFGQVKPDPFTNPEVGEYSSLKVGAEFSDLSEVPLATGGTTSLQIYPARAGFEDLIMVTSKPTPIAWTAVTFNGYIWLSLKDPQTLPSTLFWISNGGRHQEPWSGKHRHRIGLEEVNSHFCDGLEISRKNLLEDKGIPTFGKFSRRTPTSIRLIQVVHPVSARFGMVTDVSPLPEDHGVVVTGSGGEKVTVPVNWDYLQGESLR